ncbi:MAG: hypothetical protein K2L13_04325 [Opitutales bacterium]|nr:hypothetical protein [Opitutales bacterium]
MPNPINRRNNSRTPATPSTPVVPATNSSLPPQSADTPGVLGGHIIQSFDPDISHYNLITIEGKVDEQELKNRFAEVCRINADKDFIRNNVVPFDRSADIDERKKNLETSFNKLVDAYASSSKIYTYQGRDGEWYVAPKEICATNGFEPMVKDVIDFAKTSLAEQGISSNSEKVSLKKLLDSGLLKKVDAVETFKYDKQLKKTVLEARDIWALANCSNPVIFCLSTLAKRIFKVIEVACLVALETEKELNSVKEEISRNREEGIRLDTSVADISNENNDFTDLDTALMQGEEFLKDFFGE